MFVPVVVPLMVTPVDLTRATSVCVVAASPRAAPKTLPSPTVPLTPTVPPLISIVVVPPLIKVVVLVLSDVVVVILPTDPIAPAP